MSADVLGDDLRLLEGDGVTGVGDHDDLTPTGGGLIPLGLYMGAGWVAWTNPATKTRVTAILSTLGLMSAAMAFVIGRAYVEGTL